MPRLQLSTLSTVRASDLYEVRANRGYLLHRYEAAALTERREDRFQGL